MENERVLIIGGAGSLGTELVKQLVERNEIMIFSRDEAKHWDLKNKFPGRRNLVTFIGDVRDACRVRTIVRRTEPSIIIAASALKQVDTCEYFPGESVDTNVMGTRNLIAALEDFDGDHPPGALCFISTDKACNPINVYGMCKSISEKLVLRAAEDIPKVRFVVTRYGNVMSSKGSVIPLFEHQGRDPKQEFLTVTDEQMTRFMMTLEESVTLINTAVLSGLSGELWVPALDSMRIGDLARYFSRRYGKPIRSIGIRPGEKIHEVLLNEEEAAFARRDGSYFITNYANRQRGVGKEFSSLDRVVTPDVLEQRLDAFLGPPAARAS